MALLRRYGVAAPVEFPLIKRAAVDFATTSNYTPVGSDTRIHQDAASASYTTNVLQATGSHGWSLSLTATELSAKIISLVVQDADTKAVEDQFISIETYGSPLAMHAFDLSVATVTLSQPALDQAATQIVNTVWATPSRTLSSFGTLQGDIVNAVWATSSRTLAQAAYDQMVNQVWATPSRTLSSFGSLQGDIVNAVWATASRTLTGLGAGVITADAIADSGASEIAAAVWATASRTLTSLGIGVIDADAIADSGAAEIAATVWATGSRTLSSFGTLQLDIVNNVWATPSRSLAQAAYDQLVNQVWATPSRTLSSFGTLQGDIVNNVWATGSRTLTALGTGVITADAVADSGAAEIATAVWATGSRTLSSFGTLQGDIVNNVWATPSRTITGTGTDAIAAASIAAAAGSKIADIVLRRTAANARASGDGDAVAFRSLLGATSKLVNKVAPNGATLEIMEENDTTVFGSQTMTTDSAAAPITALDTV